ncbi:MAG: type II secretion system protein [Verrucomicrobiota bacterium]
MKVCLAFSRTTHRKSSAFTLLELLVVMAILSILGSMMFVSVRAAMNRVKKTQTLTTANELRNAINTYFSDYRKLPYDAKSNPGSTVRLESDEVLMNILCGMDKAAEKGGLNPARTVFYTDRNARRLEEGYHSGLRIDESGNGFLYDPWGEPYQIIFDGDANGRVDKPSWDRKTASHEITSSVLVWSKGPDRRSDTGEDNLRIW